MGFALFCVCSLGWKCVIKIRGFTLVDENKSILRKILDSFNLGDNSNPNIIIYGPEGIIGCRSEDYIRSPYVLEQIRLAKNIPLYDAYQKV